MSSLVRVCAALLCATLGFAVSAGAAVTGSCRYQGQTLHYVDAHAALTPDPFEEGQRVPTLWFATVAFDQAALFAVPAKDRDDAVTRQVFDHDSAELRLRLAADGHVVEGLQLYVPPGSNRSVSSNEVGSLQLAGPVGARIKGRFQLKDDEDLNCDLQFDVPMTGVGAPPVSPAPPKPQGQALPAGGGEPGKAYLALHHAALAGDVETMLALVRKDRADEMRAQRDKPEFAQMLAMIRALEPSEVRIVDGRVDGDSAELKIAGKEADGAALTGEVKLQREGGRWLIDSVSTESKLSQ